MSCDHRCTAVRRVLPDVTAMWDETGREVDRTSIRTDAPSMHRLGSKTASADTSRKPGAIRKDRSLDRLAETGNVAQFVSFSPVDGRAHQEFSRIAGHQPNDPFLSERMALEALLRLSSDGSINLRSFSPDDPRSREFIYGIESVDDAESALGRLLAGGLFVIANETVDVSDGGVSGVVQGGVMEFSPDDTPRCVEKGGLTSLPIAWGLSILETVYGFRPDLGATEGVRLEFHRRTSHRHGWDRSGLPSRRDGRGQARSRMASRPPYGRECPVLPGLSSLAPSTWRPRQRATVAHISKPSRRPRKANFSGAAIVKSNRPEPDAPDVGNGPIVLKKSALGSAAD
jgi:hypothetical protein